VEGPRNNSTGAFIFGTVPNADVQRCLAEHLIISPLQSNWHARGDRLSALQVYRLSRIYPPNIQPLLTSAFDALLRGFGSLSMSGLLPCIFLVYIACSVPQLNISVVDRQKYRYFIGWQRAIRDPHSKDAHKLD
jgi:hypothetical protein